MITQSGIHIQKRDGITNVPRIIDIAVHAGRICRFGGALWSPLLAHLVFVGLMAYRRTGNSADALWGMLHDAHETITGEVPRPFKCDCMRSEQAFLDTQITTLFPDNVWNGMDMKVIKECDIDACDIEANVLGLPTYNEVTIANGPAYNKFRDKPYEDQADGVLFVRLTHSPFFLNTIDGMNSLGVMKFAHALQSAASGDMKQFEAEITSWNLISC